MSPTISIIIPVYKVESFLPKCIDSVLSQTYTDFELLLIDDGSPDQSGQICEEYAAKDSRIKVFHKSNGGVSSARNLGLEHALGEWITFVDADDFLPKDSMQTLINAATKDSTMVIGGFEPFGNVFPVEPLTGDAYNKDTLGICLARYMKSMCFGTPWGKLFRSETIRQHRFRFDEKIRFNEDFLFNQQVFETLNGGGTLQTVNKLVYHWRNEESFSGKYGLGVDEYVYTLLRLNEMYDRLTHEFHFAHDEYIRGVFNAQSIRLLVGGERLLRSLADLRCFRSNVRQLDSVRHRFRTKGSLKLTVLFFLIRHRMYWLLRVALYVLCFSKSKK